MKISHLGRSLPAAALFALAIPTAGQAQVQTTEARPEAGTHTVKRGDTLWDLAESYLGDAYLWPEIYRLNTDQIDDPHWIYPGEVLRLPTRGAVVAAAPEDAPGAPVAEAPRRSNEPTVFATRTRVAGRLGSRTVVAPARVPYGDFLRAPYFDRIDGPRTSGRVLFGADIPGIDVPNATTNFKLYDKILMVPPAGAVAAERDRFVAYALQGEVAGVGSIVVPTAVLEVLRAPRNEEPAIVRVVELFGMLNADERVIPLDTAGSSSNLVPVPVSATSVRTTTIRSVHRPAVLPALDYYILFDLAARDGMKVGDEVQVYRERAVPRGDDAGPTIPEVAIATGQVVKVTQYGATARITSMDQPAIRTGEHVRVTARMP